MITLPTGIVTFLFTDIEGSTRLWEEHPDDMHVALQRHEEILRACVEAHGGGVFKMVGDACCAAFSSVPDAFGAALDAQRAMQSESWPEGIALRVRAALHTGQAQERDGDYFGPPLNRVARLMAAGHGGQTLISFSTFELARDQLPPHVELQDLGDHRLKDLGQSERIFQLLAPDLHATFPPLRTLSPIKTNLPVQPTPFIGRDNELHGVVEMLGNEDIRLLTLTGPGGTGKTRLAIEAAAHLGDTFADGVWFVALAPIDDPALVLSTLAQTLGVRETPGQPILTTLHAYLLDKHMLLVLDNFEQVLTAAAEIGTLLSSCPRLTILVTSRFVLHLYAEHEHAVSPFELPAAGDIPSLEQLTQYDALQLFVQRARMVRPGFSLTDDNARAVVAICRRLDGLPLAIELAAARIKVLPPEALLARMDDRLKLLTGGGRDLPSRQRTLRDAIAWSHDLLDEAEQTLFRRLAIFVDGCTLGAAEAVCDPDNDIDVLDGLTSLVDKSLLRQEEAPGPEGYPEPRFSMLETIREFAVERMRESGEAAMLAERHARYFSALAGDAFYSTMSAGREPFLEMVGLERDNIRATQQWSLEHRQPELAMPIVGRLWVWYLHEAPADGLRWEQELLAMPEAQRQTVARGWGLAGAVISAWTVGRLDLSYQYATEAIAIAREVGDDPELLVAALVSIAGRVPEQSVAAAGEARELCRAMWSKPGTPDRLVAAWKMAFALASWQPAFTLPYHGDVATVAVWLEEALAIGRETNDTWVQAVVLMFQGFIVAAGGDLETASVLLTQSADLYRRTPDKLNLAGGLVTLGGISVVRGDIARAAELLCEGLALSRALSSPGNIAACIEGLAGVALAQGDPRRGARLLGAGKALRDATSAVALPTSDALNAGIAAAVQSALDDASFQRAFADGLAMTGDQAVSYALDLAPVQAPELA